MEIAINLVTETELEFIPGGVYDRTTIKIEIESG
jgi:hypothetical protein